jgi:hypothetical protein
MLLHVFYVICHYFMFFCWFSKKWTRDWPLGFPTMEPGFSPPPPLPPPLSLFPPGRGVRGAWAGFPPGAWGLGRVPPRGLAPSARAHGTHNTHQEPGTHPQLRLIRLIRLIRFLWRCKCRDMHTHINFISFSLFAQHKLHSANTHHAVPTPSTSFAYKGYSSYGFDRAVISCKDHHVPKKHHSCPCSLWIRELIEQTDPALAPAECTHHPHIVRRNHEGKRGVREMLS